MPGIHHPKNPADPSMLVPHSREECERERCGLPAWRIEDQAAYRSAVAAERERITRELGDPVSIDGDGGRGTAYISVRAVLAIVNPKPEDPLQPRPRSPHMTGACGIDEAHSEEDHEPSDDNPWDSGYARESTRNL